MPITPKMNLNLPVPTSTLGPAWAQQLNDALDKIDNHDHSSGSGTKVTPSGLNINAALDINNNNVLNVNTLELINQSATLSGVSYACSLQFSNGNFFIVNSGGTPVQLTNGNSIMSTTVVPGNPLMPSGTVLDYAGATVPAGFLLCDGSAVSRTTYADLFTAIGTVYGTGDGSTTFNLPNFAGRTSIGRGTYVDSVLGSVTRSIAQLIGAAAHFLTTGEMPSHNHTQDAHTHTVSGPGGGLIAGSGASYNINTTTVTTSSAQPTIQATGGGQSHNNMQPSLVVTKMIKT